MPRYGRRLQLCNNYDTCCSLMVSYSSNTSRRLCRCPSLLRAASVDNDYGCTRKLRTFDSNSQRRGPISLLSIA